MRGHIEIKEMSDKNIWERFNLSMQYPSYFQSFRWGEVQRKAGTTVFRLGIFKDRKLVGIIQVFEIKAKRGHFLHIRGGPVLKEFRREVVLFVVGFLKDQAKELNTSFIRISPLVSFSEKTLTMLSKFGFRDAPIHNVDAENRWILRLNVGLPEILSNMRKTTRYMIRKGEKMGIKITRSQKLSDINKFLNIYKETAKLKKFVPHSLISEEFEEFGKDKKAFLYFAILNGNLLGSAVIIYYGNEAIYRHGATSFEGRKTPASYLLIWEAIKDATKSKMSIFNFWGISTNHNTENPWFGLSQFKMGFGGERVDFIHSMDLPQKRSYWFSYAIDFLTKLGKGYV